MAADDSAHFQWWVNTSSTRATFASVSSAAQQALLFSTQTLVTFAEAYAGRC